MATDSGPKSPSQRTVKQLFALSGNRCAFDDCSTRLIHPSGSVVGELCHIKGEKPTAPRYDPSQDNLARNGFDNLILLCNVHHKVIDDNPAKYSVERLVAMKKSHERLDGKEGADDALTETFLRAVMDGPVVVSLGQSGGITAQTVNVIQQAAGHGHGRVVRIETHHGDYEDIDLNGCQRLGRPIVPSWLGESPDRLSSIWLVERMTAGANLRLYLDRNWGNGTYFVADLDNDDGVVINFEQLQYLQPASPTTTTTTTPSPEELWDDDNESR